MGNCALEHTSRRVDGAPLWPCLRGVCGWIVLGLTCPILVAGWEGLEDSRGNLTPGVSSASCKGHRLASAAL
jgi:hypothetical protein